MTTDEILSRWDAEAEPEAALQDVGVHTPGGRIQKQAKRVRALIAYINWDSGPEPAKNEPEDILLDADREEAKP
jgi:hypothetical protein